MLISTLGASLSGNMLSSGKGVIRAGYGNKQGKGIARAGFGSLIKKGLIPPDPLTNFEIQKYYQAEPGFNGVYSRDNLPKTIKNGAYVNKLDDYADVVTMYNNLVTKVNKIDTTGFVLKTKYNTDKSDLKKKISDAEKKFPNTSGLVKKQI